MLIPTAEPFYFPGGKTGCLVAHGFTGTPKEMRWLGEHLAGEGFSVLGPRLAGHATQPDDLRRMQWQDWFASLEDGWHVLRGACQQVFVMGLSLGGALALLFAARFPVSGVVAMSTLYDLPPDSRLPYLSLLRRFVRSVPKGPPDWKNPQAAQDHIAYPDYPSTGILQMRDLLAVMRAELPHIQAPALLVHSRQDRSVAPENMPLLYQSLGSQEKRMLWLENSGHVVTREPERDFLFQSASEFIHGVIKKKEYES
jgi:carboxylesterase